MLNDFRWKLQIFTNLTIIFSKKNAKELVKHVFLRATLRMNEHKMHDVAVTILW